MKKKKKRSTTRRTVKIKDLSATSAREDAVRGGADPINSGKIKKL